MARVNPGLYLIGVLDLEDEVQICDPCYTDGGTVLAVKPGKWSVWTVLATLESWGTRNHALIITHETASAPSFEERMSYTEELGTEGVDSGQMGIYDLEGWEVNCPSEDDYDDACESTSSPIGAGMLKDYGAVCSSGYGDGTYDIFGKIDDDGNIIAVEVCFIPEKNDTRFPEDDH